MNQVISAKTTSHRNYSLDVARVVAICLVVMVHACAQVLSTSADNSLHFLTANIFDALSRAGVPLFLMISGALLLDESRKVSPMDMFRKALCTLGLLVIWSVIYAVAFKIIVPVLSGKPVSLFGFVKHVIAGHFHMWYLYMLVGLYLATPILRCFVKKENANLVLLYIAIALVATFSRPLISILATYHDIFSYAAAILDKFTLDFFACFITYYLTGWYIVHIGISKEFFKKLICILGGLSVMIIIGITQLTKDYENMYDNSNIFVYLYSLGIFTLLLDVKTDRIAQNPKPMLTLSGLSFGIYIIHAGINTVAETFLSELHPLVQIPLQFAVVLAISGFCALVLSKIPVFKKLVRA